MNDLNALTQVLSDIGVEFDTEISTDGTHLVLLTDEHLIRFFFTYEGKYAGLDVLPRH